MAEILVKMKCRAQIAIQRAQGRCSLQPKRWVMEKIEAVAPCQNSQAGCMAHETDIQACQNVTNRSTEVASKNDRHALHRERERCVCQLKRRGDEQVEADVRPRWPVRCPQSTREGSGQLKPRRSEQIKKDGHRNGGRCHIWALNGTDKISPALSRSSSLSFYLFG